MKILLATGIYPPEIGGPATVIADLKQVLHAQGHEVKVLTYGEAREESDVVCVPRSGSVATRYFRFFLAMRKLLTPESVVMTTDVFSVGLPVRFALIRKKNKLIIRLGGEWFWEDSVEKGRVFIPLKDFWRDNRWSWRRWLARLNYGWQLKRAETIAVTSDMLACVLRIICPPATGKITTVGNFAAPQVCAAKNGAHPHQPLRLLYVGRFARVKNVPFLAGVIKILDDEGTEVACIFAGDGPTMAQTKEILRQTENIKFLGNVPQEKIAALLDGCDLLVLPSLSDVCPNIVLEALACNVPVLMTKEHGLPSGLGGIVELSPLDQPAWIEVIRRLSGTEEYTRVREQIGLPINKPQLGLLELLAAI